MAEIKIETFDSAGAFLEALRRSNDRWWDSGSHSQTHYFRGQANQAWDLIASGLRPLENVNRLKPMLDRVRRRLNDLGVEKRTAKSQFEYLVWVYALDESYRRFSDVCLRLGLPTNFAPIPSIFYSDWEPDLNPGFELRHIRFHAQHHRMPTSVLDWSEDPFVAAYFALEDKTSSGDLCVWAMDVTAQEFHAKAWPDGKLTLHRASYPSVSNSYQRSQRGHFTSLRNQERWFKERGTWPSLQDFHALLDGEPILTKLVLPRSEAGHLSNLLYREGLSEAVLMPSYDNAAKQAWESFEWEP